MMTPTRLKQAFLLSFACAVSFGVTWILLGPLQVLFPETMTARHPLFASALIGLGLILPLPTVTYRIMRNRASRERTLILGTSPLALQLVHEIESQPCRYTVVGVVDDGMRARDVSFDYPLWGPLERLDRIIDALQPQRIIVALADRRGRLPVRQLLESRVCRGIVVEDGVDVYERLTGKIAIESLTPSSLIFSKEFWRSRPALPIERGLSLVAAVIGLVTFAPLFGLIALAIKLDSRGPVLFVQERMGLCSKPFTLLKFRTMHPVNGTTSEWAGDNGDRITRVGKWLRRFRLDELPQLVNIVLGDMNLVGPRPHPVSNVALFVETIPYYSVRAAVRPGLTGWAQVRYGYANNLDEEMEKMRYDLYYIKHMSIGFNLRILLDTVKIVFLSRGWEAAAAPRPGAREDPPPAEVNEAA